MLRNWKSGQEPDGPAYERNPSEPPKTPFAERGREHSSWRSFWGQENECDGGRYLCDDSLTPWSGPEWASRPSSWARECPGTLKGQCSIHALRDCSRRQGQAKGKDLVLVSLPSKGKPKELPVLPDDLDVDIGILQVDSDEPVPSLNLRYDSLQRQHLELPFVKGEVQAT